MSLAESSLYGNPSGSNFESNQQEKDSELGLNATTFIPKTQDDYVCAINRNDRPCPRDPDVDAPTTFSEKCFNVFSKFVDWLYSMESVFAFKTTAGFMLLSIPAYLPQSVGWFTDWGGQWVANTLLMWMIPMAGMFNFTQVLNLLFGLIGTVIGAVFSIVIWEISRGNPYGLAILSFVAITPFHYLALKNEVFNFLSIMMSYMYLMIITTAYQTAVGEDLQDNIIELAAGKRLIFVTLGIICSFLINLIPRPVTGRVELRRRIACTLSDMSLLHGIIFADILMDSSPESSNQKGTTMNQIRAFRQLTLHVQRQLKDEETYLRLSRYEPPLKGKFPHATYQTLIDKLNTMADLIEGMAYTSRNMDKSWRKRLMHALNEDKIDYVACLTTNMRHLSAALRAKMPLPPYMISPNDLKEKLAGIFSSAISSYPEEADNESLPNFCAYSAASYLFIQEFNEASECIEKLLGVEDPQKWLLMHM
ncbi:MAG: hypothetical protein EXX96DRAFT_481656 [Benjaminiella poitrasii]|nr:MAG: hypothetical protein EXX96DRAFT_481656 [Benjaminiella poitrasii]